MGLKIDIDRRAVIAGAVLGIAFLVPTYIGMLLLNAVLEIPDDSNLWFLPYSLMLWEVTLAGARAARLRPEAPLTHGALAALFAYTPVVLAVMGISVAQGTRIASAEILDVAAVVLFGISMSIAAGILGGLLTTRRRRRRPSPRRGAVS